MKKRIILLIAILLTISLFSGCNTSVAPSAEHNLAEENPEAAQLPALEEDHGIPMVSITHQTEYRYAPDDETVVLEANVDKVTLAGEGYEKAAETVVELFESNQTQLDNMAVSAREDYEYSKSIGDAHFFPYYISSACSVTKLDENILSMRNSGYEYIGGSYGYNSVWGTTIDLATGEELELIDLAVDSYALVDTCTQYVLKEFSGRKVEFVDGYETYVSEHLQNCYWYLDAAGIQFVFPANEITTYEVGDIIVCVPYSQVSKHMKPEYCGLHGSSIAKVDINNEVSFETEGNTRKLVFESKSIGEYEEQVTLKVDKKKVALTPNVFLNTAYLVRNKDSKVFLLYTIDWASDDYETYIYDLSGKEFKQTANIWAQLNNKNLSQNSISLGFTLQVLGTYGADMTYVLNEDGTIEPTEDIFVIGSHEGRTGITTIKELPVTVDGVETTLPVGTRIYITATDNEGTVWFETANEKGDFKTGEIHYVRDAEDYMITIDGVSEFEYFETLPYVG